MRKCLRCGTEMTEGFVLMQELSLLLEIKLADNENSLNKFGDLRAAVCPKCGEVSLYSENSDLIEAEEEACTFCPACGFPVYPDEQFCSNCGQKKKEEKPRRFFRFGPDRKK